MLSLAMRILFVNSEFGQFYCLGTTWNWPNSIYKFNWAKTKNLEMTPISLSFANPRPSPFTLSLLPPYSIIHCPVIHALASRPLPFTLRISYRLYTAFNPHLRQHQYYFAYSLFVHC